jgi:hypothetical protein
MRAWANGASAPPVRPGDQPPTCARKTDNRHGRPNGSRRPTRRLVPAPASIGHVQWSMAHSRAATIAAFQSASWGATTIGGHWSSVTGDSRGRRASLKAAPVRCSLPRARAASRRCSSPAASAGIPSHERDQPADAVADAHEHAVACCSRSATVTSSTPYASRRAEAVSLREPKRVAAVRHRRIVRAHWGRPRRQRQASAAARRPLRHARTPPTSRARYRRLGGRARCRSRPLGVDDWRALGVRQLPLTVAFADEDRRVRGRSARSWNQPPSRRQRYSATRHPTPAHRGK